MGKLSNFMSEWKVDVLSKIELCNQSITWWESRLDVLFVKLDEIEESEWYPEKDADLDSVTEDIQSLMSRGKFEWDNLQILQTEMDSMLDAIKDEIAPKAMRIDINVTF
jgi:hypothetical protein